MNAEARKNNFFSIDFNWLCTRSGQTRFLCATSAFSVSLWFNMSSGKNNHRGTENAEVAGHAVVRVSLAEFAYGECSNV